MIQRAGAVTMKGKPKTLIGPELKVGDNAPDFQCLDMTMQPVSLASTGGKIRIFSVVPSLDTPVCDMQTKRFNDEAAKLEDIDIYTVSVDLPFAQRRYCTAFGTDNVKMLSDHKDVSFGTNWGVLIEDLRILARAIFVVDKGNIIKHAEYVPEVTEHPNYDAALAAAKKLAV